MRNRGSSIIFLKLKARIHKGGSNLTHGLNPHLLVHTCNPWFKISANSGKRTLPCACLPLTVSHSLILG